MTEEELTICKMYLEDLDRTHDCNEYKLLMGLLEQQPSDDCVSRKEVLEALKNNRYSDAFCDEHGIERSINLNMSAIAICELPPVTPTHGTCKDCQHWCHVDGYDSLDTCKLVLRTVHKDFYCADFEKRGAENE